MKRTTPTETKEDKTMLLNRPIREAILGHMTDLMGPIPA